MRQITKNRFWKLMLFAALALMFWLFNLTTLAWIFGAFVIGPLILGAVLWMFKKPE